MEYSKLFIILCLFIAVINAIPVPPSNPSTFLEDNGMENSVEVQADLIEEVTDNSYQEEQEDEPVFVDAEVNTEVNTDVNSVVADNIGNITNDILGSVSYSIKSALEKELGSKTNDASTNNAVNDVVVDLLTKTSDAIKDTVGNILETDIEKADLKTIATETADKIGGIIGKDMVGSILTNINDKLEIDSKIDTKAARDILDNTVESVEGFLKKNLETTKAVVDKALSNENTDELLESVSNANDIATVVTNGVSFLIKNNLCESLDNKDKEVCKKLSESIISSSATLINEIISSNIKASTGEGLTVACAIIPSDVFEKLTSVVVNVISTELGNLTDGENVSKIANKILTIIINSIEHLLCASKVDALEAGTVLLKDVSDLASHIINKVNDINDNVVSTLNKEKEKENNTISGNIASDISEIQDSLKDGSEGQAEEQAEEPTIIEGEAEVEAEVEAEEPTFIEGEAEVEPTEE